MLKITGTDMKGLFSHCLLQSINIGLHELPLKMTPQILTELGRSTSKISPK